jgi:hypothetical protein
MSSTSSSSIRGTLWGFLLLLLILPPLTSLLLNVLITFVRDSGVIAILSLVAVVLLCFQFGSNAARLVVVFFALCLGATILGRPATSWATYVVLVGICIFAYWIREQRAHHKHESPKLQGVERTPVLPTHTDEHE